MISIIINIKDKIVDFLVKMGGTRYYWVVCQAGLSSHGQIVACYKFRQLDIMQFMEVARQSLNIDQTPNVSCIIEISHTQAK